MYDLVHRYAPDIEARWVPRHEVKAVPKEGEALKLANMEVTQVAMRNHSVMNPGDCGVALLLMSSCMMFREVHVVRGSLVMYASCGRQIKWKLAIRKKREQDERKAKLKKARDLQIQKQE